MEPQDFYLLQAARDLYTDARGTIDVLRAKLQSLQDGIQRLDPKALSERDRLNEVIDKNTVDMNISMQIVQETRDKYFGERREQYANAKTDGDTTN